MEREIKFKFHFDNHAPVILTLMDLITGDDFFNLYRNNAGMLIAKRQFTGLKDKNGKEVFEGDILRWCEIQTEYQTHEGDNIPLGSYTEPCGVLAKWVAREVRFTAPAFTTNHPEEDFAFCPIGLVFLNDFHYDIQSMTDIFFFGKKASFEEIWDAALGVSEELKIHPKDFDEFISIVSGFEVIGNIHEHPELLKQIEK